MPDVCENPRVKEVGQLLEDQVETLQEEYIYTEGVHLISSSYILITYLSIHVTSVVDSSDVLENSQVRRSGRQTPERSTYP